MTEFRTSDMRRAIAATLQALRMEKGLSQEALGERSGLHPTYISLLERARRSPTIDTIVRLAAALNDKPSSILAAAESAIKGGRPHE